MEKDTLVFDYHHKKVLKLMVLFEYINLVTDPIDIKHLYEMKIY